MSLAYLGYGSNLGDKNSNIENGIAEISKRGIGTVLRKSNFYITEPVGTSSGNDFLNLSVEIMTDLEPHDLLQSLRSIEADYGRERERDKNAPRTLDIDILLYDFMVINDALLKIPHPEIANRRFLLQTLNEIRPDLLHPGYQKSMSDLLAAASPEILKQRITPL